jgi:hypothetical protein
MASLTTISASQRGLWASSKALPRVAPIPFQVTPRAVKVETMTANAVLADQNVGGSSPCQARSVHPDDQAPEQRKCCGALVVSNSETMNLMMSIMRELL